LDKESMAVLSDADGNARALDAAIAAALPRVRRVEPRTRGEWRSALDELSPELDRYPRIHTIPTTACVVVGLVLSNGNVERAS
jgi:hypothetical protein